MNPSRSKGWWTAAFERGAWPLPQVAELKDKKGDTRAETSNILKLISLQKGARVLDVGCGVGRHSVALARRGYAVSGIDISAAYLKLASARAKRAGVKARFLKRDMRSLQFNEEFDAALSVFTSFGYFRKAEDDRRVAQGVYRSLKPNGKFLLELFNGTKVKKRLSDAEREKDPVLIWQEFRDKSLLLEQPVYSVRLGGTLTRWIYISRGRRREVTSFTRAYSKETLVRLLRKVGFRSIRIFGDLARSRYVASKSDRLVALAFK